MKTTAAPQTRALVALANWRYLLRALLGQPAGRCLVSVTSDLQKNLLAAPVAVALWIEEFAPELKSRKSLHIVIAGATNGPDSVDEGRWYQLVPTLLGVPEMTLTVSLVGEEIGELKGSARAAKGYSGFPGEPVNSSLEDAVQHFAPASVHNGSLGAFLEARGGGPLLDLVFIFHPDFADDSESWLLSGDLRAALAEDIPIGLAAPDEAEQMHEAWLLDAYGYGADAKVVKNRFKSEDVDGVFPTSYARLLWKVAPGAPPEGFAPDPYRLAQSERYLEWLSDSIDEDAEYSSLLWLGNLPAGWSEGKPRIVGVPSGHLIDLDDGEVFGQDEDGDIVPTTLELSEDLLSRYPEDSPFDFERALWALDVSYLLEDAETDEEEHGNPGFLFSQDRSFQDGMRSFMQEMGDLMRGRPPMTQTPGTKTFFAALEKRNWARAAELIQAKPKLTQAVDDNGQTALFKALDGGNIEFAAKLLSAGCDPSHQDNEGFTPLHEAAKRRHAEAADLLIRGNAELDTKTNMGWTPLLSAMTCEASEVVELLVRAGADLHVSNLVGMTPATIFEEMPLSKSAHALIQSRLEAHH